MNDKINIFIDFETLERKQLYNALKIDLLIYPIEQIIVLNEKIIAIR
jgi:hypothetical protein